MEWVFTNYLYITERNHDYSGKLPQKLTEPEMITKVSMSISFHEDLSKEIQLENKMFQMLKKKKKPSKAQSRIFKITKLIVKIMTILTAI